MKETDNEPNEQAFAHQFAKTDVFEKAVVVNMLAMQTMWNAMKRHESFRMELKYDAKALNVTMDYFTDESDEHHQE